MIEKLQTDRQVILRDTQTTQTKIDWTDKQIKWKWTNSIDRQIQTRVSDRKTDGSYRYTDYSGSKLHNCNCSKNTE